MGILLGKALPPRQYQQLVPRRGAFHRRSCGSGLRSHLVLRLHPAAPLRAARPPPGADAPQQPSSGVPPSSTGKEQCLPMLSHPAAMRAPGVSPRTTRAATTKRWGCIVGCRPATREPIVLAPAARSVGRREPRVPQAGDRGRVLSSAPVAGHHLARYLYQVGLASATLSPLPCLGGNGSPACRRSAWPQRARRPRRARPGFAGYPGPARWSRRRDSGH